MSGRSQLQRALLDAATILSSAANVAKRAAATIDPGHVASGNDGGGGIHEENKKRSTSSPWPSQSIALQKAHSVSTNHIKTSLSPSAPDDSLTEMKVLNKGIGRQTESDEVDRLQNNEDLLRQLDVSLKGYFDDTEPASTVHKDSINEEVKDIDATLDPIPTPNPSKEADDIATHTSAEILQLPPSASATVEEAEKFQSASSNIPNTEQSTVKATPISSLQGDLNIEEYDATSENAKTPLRAAKVPSSRIARLLHYGSLGAGLAWGAAGSFLSGSTSQGKQFMSDDNIRRLVDKLSTMRGAALKLGQFMSIQDSNLLPEQIEQVMLRVQNSANYMPAWQMEQVMREDLGLHWRDSFSSFNDVPFASASIGQVHSATLADDHPSELAGQKVAVKVQFPGVRDSIGSDLSNLRWLVSASALLPKGLFLDNTIRVMRRELDDECDYEREKDMCKRFGELLNGKSNFTVPKVVDELCSKRVLTCEMMKGRPLTQASRYSQEKRDNIARSILELSLRELFTFRLMQTDPNWTNFLYNERNGKIELIDFGATREYDKDFMDDWLCMLRAAIGGQREECVKWSEKVGYLTGKETDGMRDAHVNSMIALGEPFRPDAPNPYPFAEQTITARVRAQIPLMLRERLTPPPEPTYSLNRKLSGAFLLCARLKANVECKDMLRDVTSDYVLGNQGSSPTVASVGLGRRGLHTFHGSLTNLDAKRRQRLGNLATRWPRNIVELVEEQHRQKESRPVSGGFVSLASNPVGPSMVSTPSDTTSRSASFVDLQSSSPSGEKKDTAAESPKTAMELASSLRRPKLHTIRGVSIPSKPPPPGPEDCCMSGCAHCAYDIYADSSHDFQEDLTIARNHLLSLTPPVSNAEWNVSLLGKRPDDKEEKEDGRSPAEKAQAEVDAVIGNLDPSMKAFLELERSLKRSGKHTTSNANA